MGSNLRALEAPLGQAPGSGSGRRTAECSGFENQASSSAYPAQGVGLAGHAFLGQDTGNDPPLRALA